MQETVLVCGKEYVGDGGGIRSYLAPLKLPALPPTDEKSSNICKVRYILRVTGKSSGCNPNMVIEIPITIGTYPLRDDDGDAGDAGDAAAATTNATPATSTITPTAPPIYDAIQFIPLSPLSEKPSAPPSAPYPEYGKFYRIEEMIADY